MLLSMAAGKTQALSGPNFQRHAEVCVGLLQANADGAKATQLCDSYQLPGTCVWIQKVMLGSRKHALI